MVTYDDFSKFSNISVSSSDFAQIEARSVDLLACLCRSAWDETDSICKKAVMYQIEFVVQNGGLSSWSIGKGVIGSQSYSIGGESESVTYIQSKGSENAKTFNGLAISPLAWALLTDNGILRTARGIRIW
jgi:hypothetical protein